MSDPDLGKGAEFDLSDFAAAQAREVNFGTSGLLRRACSVRVNDRGG